MAKVLEESVNGNIINFVSLLGVNIYGIYLQDASMEKVMKSFYENYQCKNISPDGLYIYSDHLARNLEESDMQKSTSDYNFPSITCFRLKPKQDIITTDFIPDRAETAVSVANPEHMQIFCAKVGGGNLVLDVNSGMTGTDLKNMIRDRENIDPSIIRLSMAGKEIKDKTLKEYGIKNGANIYISFRLCGGMFHETSGRSGNYGELTSNLFYIN